MDISNTPHDFVQDNNAPVVAVPSLSDRLWATVGYVVLGPLFLLVFLEAFFLEDCFVRKHARRVLAIVFCVIVASLIPLFYLIATVPHESELVSFDQQLNTSRHHVLHNLAPILYQAE